MNLFDLKGKTALVTGGIHGLGMAMAEGLAKAGAELIITNNTKDSLELEKLSIRLNGLSISIISPKN